MLLRLSLSLPVLILLNFNAGVSWGAKSGLNCYGRNTGPRADPSNCHQYYMCIKGISFTARCKPGTVFNLGQQKCLTGASVPCNSDEEALSLLGRKCQIEGKILPSLISCDKYLICRSRRYMARKCPFGLVFHNRKFKCVVPPDPCAIEDPNELKNISSSVQDNGPYVGICDAKIGKLVPEPFDCSMYIECEEDTTDPNDIFIAMKISECPTGQLFDADRQVCDDPIKIICGSRYRVVTLFGPEPNHASQSGRSIGGSQGNSTPDAQPSNPKFGPQPGKYRAISRMVLTRSDDSQSQDIVAEENVDSSNKRNQTRGMGRGIITSNGNQNNYTKIHPLAAIPVTSVDGMNINNMIFHDSRETYIKSPMILKFIMGEKRKSPVATLILDNGQHSDEYSDGAGVDHHHQTHHSVISKADCALNKTNQLQRSALSVPDSSKPGAKPSPKPGFAYEYYDADLSKESHEDETFGKIRSRKNFTRGSKRQSFIDEYQAGSLSKKLNATTDDVLYYNDDYYYMATSVEEIPEDPINSNKSESLDISLEFTHHDIRSGRTKNKLPGRRKT